jgi:hypothetical protein
MIDQDLPHQVRSQGDEMAAIPDFRLPLLHQPQIRLVDEGRGLQRMIRPLRPQVTPRQPA